jgi:membrane protein DedA with SNARE-associated domain
MSDPGSDILSWAVNVMLALGYVGLALLVALETIVPPIPSEVILPLAGFLAGQGHFSVLGLIAAATVGSLVGALTFYAAGRALGERRMRRLLQRFGRWILLEEHDLETAHEWFKRRGALAVLVGRLVPAVRSYVSLPAGLARMPLAAFVVLTAAGSGAWNAILIGAGWLLGERWQDVGGYVQPLGRAVPFVVLGLVIWFVWGRIRAKRAS